MISMIAFVALVAGIASAQSLDVPERVGEVVALPQPSVISGVVDFGNQEFDRGHPCDSDLDTGDVNAVFILEDGAAISNVIIGVNALEGVHCRGACNITNVWFREVCEDAISLLGPGDSFIVGGGAQEATDKVIQHNGIGTVTIRDYLIINAGKLYRSCGDCTNNEAKSPRKVIIENVRAFGVVSDLIGINSNLGDTASISGSCGTTKKVCNEYVGVNKGNGASVKLNTNVCCLGDQGKLPQLPICAEESAPATVARPTMTVIATPPKQTKTTLLVKTKPASPTPK